MERIALGRAHKKKLASENSFPDVPDYYEALLVHLPPELEDFTEEIAGHMQQRLAEGDDTPRKKLKSTVAEILSLALFIGKKRVFRIVGERKRKVE